VNEDKGNIYCISADKNKVAQKNCISVGTRNRCCEQYMHCFVENIFRCKSAKNYKIRLRFHIKQMEICSFFGPCTEFGKLDDGMTAVMHAMIALK